MSHRSFVNPVLLRRIAQALFVGVLCGLPAMAASAQSTPDPRLPLGLWGSIQSLAGVQTVATPAVDHATLPAEDVTRAAAGLAPRYAVPISVSHQPEAVGTWELAPNGEWAWRLVVRSPGALSLNFGFTRYHMPAGGRLFIYTPDGVALFGPFTDADNESHRQLWTPPVPGDTAIIEVNLPADAVPLLDLELGAINHGYTTAFLDLYTENTPESGSCNVDVICPEGDAWRSEIRSVAVISTGGSTFCTGFLVNNVRGDQTPYFMTAQHCGITAANAASLVVFWNYENSTCRPPGSPASGGPGNGTLTDFQTGAFFRASGAASDFTLVELDSAPAAASNVHWAGWDNTTANPTSAVGIHHPNTDEKRISFENNPLTTTVYGGSIPVLGGDHVRVTDWDLGTTEGGSSGSPLWNQDHRVVGQLHGGGAACGNNLSDWYGRFSTSWAGGGTAATRLRDWLDPDNTGATVLDGRDRSPALPTIAWTTPPPATAAGGDPIPLAWELTGFGGPITDHQAHFGITSVLGSSPVQPGTNAAHSYTFTAPNVGTWVAPETYAYIIRALDSGAQILSTPGFTAVSAGPTPPTVAWVTPPSASVPSGGQFTAAWQLTNYVDPATANAVGWGVTSIIGQTPDQPGGNAIYTATVNVPAVGGPGTLFYTAFAQNPIEFAFAPITPVLVTAP